MEIEKLGDWLIEQLESREMCPSHIGLVDVLGQECVTDGCCPDCSMCCKTSVKESEVELLEEVAEGYDFGEKQRAFDVQDNSDITVLLVEDKPEYQATEVSMDTCLSVELDDKGHVIDVHKGIAIHDDCYFCTTVGNCKYCTARW